MRLFPKIDGVINGQDGILWLPFASFVSVITGVPDKLEITVWITQAKRIDIER